MKSSDQLHEQNVLLNGTQFFKCHFPLLLTAPVIAIETIHNTETENLPNCMPIQKLMQSI
jgi:hypothetical protein